MHCIHSNEEVVALKSTCMIVLEEEQHVHVVPGSAVESTCTCSHMTDAFCGQMHCVDIFKFLYCMNKEYLLCVG